MSSWIERGREMAEEAVNEAAAAAQRRDRVESAAKGIVDHEQRVMFADAMRNGTEVVEKLRIAESLEDIFRRHWKLGEEAFLPDYSSYALRFRYLALLSVMRTESYGEGFQDGTSTGGQLLVDTGARLVEEVETSLEIVVHTRFMVNKYRITTSSGAYTMTPDNKAGNLSVVQVIPDKRRVRNSNGEYELPNTRYYNFRPTEPIGESLVDVKYKNRFGFYTGKALNDMLSAVCYQRESNHSWPENLQAVEDAAILKAIDEGVLNSEGVDPRIIEEVRARHQSRIEASSPISGFWEMISSGQR